MQNVQLLEEAFYSGKKEDQNPTPDNPDAEVLMMLLQNPEMAALINALAKNLQ